MYNHFLKWKNITKSRGSDSDLIHDYMRERFQITDKKLNIFNILETIISPENSETNSVTQNQIACAIKKQVPAGRKKRGVEALQGKCFPLFVIKATRHKSYNNKAFGLFFPLIYCSCRVLYPFSLSLQVSVSQFTVPAGFCISFYCSCRVLYLYGWVSRQETSSRTG